jgi:hypothetical protein
LQAKRSLLLDESHPDFDGKCISGPIYFCRCLFSSHGLRRVQHLSASCQNCAACSRNAVGVSIELVADQLPANDRHSAAVLAIMQAIILSNAASAVCHFSAAFSCPNSTVK